jgi:hypothetical protein
LKEIIMTSFVHPSFPTEHAGVARVESVIAAAGDIRQNFDSTRTLAGMLLAAIAAALVVVADQMVDTWADGHLMAAWVALWAVAFVGLALLAPAAKRLAAKLSADFAAWSAREALARSERQYLDSARHDPRIMADLQAALARNKEQPIPETVNFIPARMAALRTGSALRA